MKSLFLKQDLRHAKNEPSNQYFTKNFLRNPERMPDLFHEDRNQDFAKKRLVIKGLIFLS